MSGWVLTCRKVLKDSRRCNKAVQVWTLCSGPGGISWSFQYFSYRSYIGIRSLWYKCYVWRSSEDLRSCRSKPKPCRILSGRPVQLNLIRKSVTWVSGRIGSKKRLNPDGTSSACSLLNHQTFTKEGWCRSLTCRTWKIKSLEPDQRQFKVSRES